MTATHLIVALGNPGETYALNRHNAGFIVADEIIKHCELEQAKNKFNSLVYKGKIAGEQVVLIKPLTFMNNSGQSVLPFIKLLKLQPSNVIVIYDEIDLKLGKVKVKLGGGSAGHNGIKSIDAHIGPGYVRLRIGVGHPGSRDLVHRYVLGDFGKAELEHIRTLGSKIAELMPYLLEKRYDMFLAKLI
jgi:PTH1 family peptidyl-tRNA hydrolase